MIGDFDDDFDDDDEQSARRIIRRAPPPTVRPSSTPTPTTRVVATDRRQRLTSPLVASVPTSRADVFAHPLDWSVYDAASIDDVAREWISKKLTTLMGESEPALVRFVVDKLGIRARASRFTLVADLEPVLSTPETDAFVLGLWRVLIFETKKHDARDDRHRARRRASSRRPRATESQGCSSRGSARSIH